MPPDRAAAAVGRAGPALDQPVAHHAVEPAEQRFQAAMIVEVERQGDAGVVDDYPAGVVVGAGDADQSVVDNWLLCQRVEARLYRLRLTLWGVDPVDRQLEIRRHSGAAVVVHEDDERVAANEHAEESDGEEQRADRDISVEIGRAHV